MRDVVRRIAGSDIVSCEGLDEKLVPTMFGGGVCGWCGGAEVVLPEK